MSADSWAVCPRCWAAAQAEAARQAEEVQALYGKVSVEEFDKRRAELARPEADNYATFREDYEFYGADQGEIHASYAGGCNVCGLSTELKASKRFWSRGEGGSDG